MDTPTAPSLLTAATATASAPTTAEAATVATSDFETFLTLLTAQLRNQDPLQPLDSTEFVAQLASFSTVEQLIGVNDRLDTLQSKQAEGENLALASWLGREAADTTGRFIAGEAPTTLSIPPAEVANVSATHLLIGDSTGSEVARLPVTAGGTVDVDPEALSLAAGETYTASVEYSAAEEILATAPVPVFGRIVEVGAEADGLVLRREDGLTLSPTDVAILR
ncbi:MAG: flagellar hook capping FlgD N-terminal domain-containing protein [Pseudomonadota bacterium]